MHADFADRHIGRLMVATFNQQHQTVHGNQVNLEQKVYTSGAVSRIGLLLADMDARVYGDVPADWVASIEEADSALCENPGKARSLLGRVKTLAEAAAPFTALAAALADLIKVI
jgi:hypothetical protein